MTSNDIHMQQRMHLLGLPTELRLRIFDFCFVDKFQLEVWYSASEYTCKLSYWTKDSHEKTRKHFGPLRSCRLMYMEAQPILNRSITYWLFASGPWPDLMTKPLKSFAEVKRPKNIVLCGGPSGLECHAELKAMLKALDFCAAVTNLHLWLGVGLPFEEDLQIKLDVFKSIKCPGTITMGLQGEISAPHTRAQLDDLKLLLNA